MEIKDVVRHKESDRMGVVCPTSQFLQEDGPLSVVFEGNNHSTTVLCMGGDGAFEVIRRENAVADLKGCGAGQEKECCIFLVVGSNGPECQRFGHLRETLQFRKSKMVAQREPVEPFPECQIFGQEQ